MSRNLWVVFTVERTGCSFSFLSYGGTDFLLLCLGFFFFVNGICFLRCKRDILIYRWCFDLFYLLLISGVRVFCKISALQWRNLELGMQICCRGLLCTFESSFGGVILCIFLLSDAVSLYYRDIFSGTKLTKSLVCCWTLLVIMLRFHIL